MPGQAAARIAGFMPSRILNLRVPGLPCSLKSLVAKALLSASQDVDESGLGTSGEIRGLGAPDVKLNIP